MGMVGDNGMGKNEPIKNDGYKRENRSESRRERSSESSWEGSNFLADVFEGVIFCLIFLFFNSIQKYYRNTYSNGFESAPLNPYEQQQSESSKNKAEHSKKKTESSKSS